MSFQVIGLIASVVSAIGKVEEGYAKREEYRLKAQQAQLQSERQALEYERKGVNMYNKINQANAAAAARAYAGGVKGYDGSAGLVQKVSEERGGREILYTKEGAEAARRAGFTQAGLYERAGERAVTSGWFSAATQVGIAAYNYGNTGGPQQTPAPVVDRSFYSSLDIFPASATDY